MFCLFLLDASHATTLWQSGKATLKICLHPALACVPIRTERVPPSSCTLYSISRPIPRQAALFFFSVRAFYRLIIALLSTRCCIKICFERLLS